MGVLQCGCNSNTDEMSRINKSTETESSLAVARGWRQEGRGSTYTWRVEGFFGVDEKVLELGKRGSCTTLGMYQMPLNCSL